MHASCDEPAWPDLRGRFVVLDGGEGCGKSTQLALLRSCLPADLPVTVVRDPGSTPAGERIRDLLLDPASVLGMRCEMLLYMAARAELVRAVIEPALAAGRLVLADRFVSSTLAYQVGGDGLTADDVEAVARVATAGRVPDLTVVLDVPTEVAQARVIPKFVPLFAGSDDRADRDRIERRPDKYHRAVRARYLEQARRHPARYAVIDASQAVTAVQADVRRVITSRLGRT